MLKMPDWGKHANGAKAKHRIKEEQIALTWLYGELNDDRNNCYRLVGSEVTLVLNQTGEFIITMYPNKPKDYYAQERTKLRIKNGAMRSKF